jgi:hypothetical protein
MKGMLRGRGTVRLGRRRKEQAGPAGNELRGLLAGTERSGMGDEGRNGLLQPGTHSVGSCPGGNKGYGRQQKEPAGPAGNVSGKHVSGYCPEGEGSGTGRNRPAWQGTNYGGCRPERNGRAW